MEIQIREMEIEDYEQIFNLFEKTPGIVIRDADSKEVIEKYLKRNPGLSFIAEIDEKHTLNDIDYSTRIVGCIMGAHTSRRGILEHLVIAAEFRKQGLGRKLFQKSIDALTSIGIEKSFIFVFKDNEVGNKFWSETGWMLRDDLNSYSYISSENMNA